MKNIKFTLLSLICVSLLALSLKGAGLNEKVRKDLCSMHELNDGIRLISQENELILALALGNLKKEDIKATIFDKTLSLSVRNKLVCAAIKITPRNISAYVEQLINNGDGYSSSIQSFNQGVSSKMKLLLNEAGIEYQGNILMIHLPISGPQEVPIIINNQESMAEKGAEASLELAPQDLENQQESPSTIAAILEHDTKTVE